MDANRIKVDIDSAAAHRNASDSCMKLAYRFHITVPTESFSSLPISQILTSSMCSEPMFSILQAVGHQFVPS